MTEEQLKATKKRANNTLIGAILIIAMELGTYVTLSNYIGDLCVRLNASVTQVVLLFTIASGVALVCNFISAALINKVPAKALLLVGTIGFILFFVCMSLGKSLTMLYIGSIGFGLSNTFVCFTVLQPVITWWHAENVGKKIGYLSMGFSVAAIIFGTVIAKMLVTLGFEKTVLIHGIVSGAIMLFATLFLVSNRPDTYGLKPYGYKEVEGSDAAGAGVLSGMDVKDCLKTFPFWGIMLAILLCGIVSTGYSNNSSTIYQSYGLDLVKAGVMISIYNFAGIAWNYAYGAASDKIGPRKTNIIFPVIGAAVFIISSFLTGMPAAILVAITYGVLSYNGMVGAVSLPGLYGAKSVGTLIAFGMVASSLGTMIGSPLASALYEQSGNFLSFQRISFIILVIVTILLAMSTGKKAVEKLQNKQ